MSIFNTFWLIYKSNAEDVIKGNKAVEKSTKDTERSLKSTNEEAQKLGQNFVKMVEGAATAAGAIAGFNILKTGVNDAIAFNAQLKQMSDLTGQNANTLKTMGQAAASAGGSIAGALGDIQGLTNSFAQAGLQLGPADQYMSALRNRVKGLSTNEKNRQLGMAGINDPGLRWLLASSSDDEYTRRMGSAAAISATQQQVYDKSFKQIGSNADLTGRKTSALGGLGATIQPLLDWWNKTQGKVLDAAGSSPASQVASAGAFVGLSALLSGGVVSGALKLLGRFGVSGAGAGAVGTGLGYAGATLGPLAAGAAAGYGGVSLFSEQIEGAMTRYLTRDLKGGSLSGSKPGGDLGFWVSKGYTRDQALGIMANVKAESGGDPNARGDGGQAHGLFQWHPDRRANIMKNTGIDVSNAPYQQQLEAAAWEMKNGRPGFSDEYFRGIKGAEASAAYFSNKFETPADMMGQAMLRGKSALQMASQFPGFSGGGGGNSVKIDKIEINTQATDAAGIASDLRDQLHTQLSFLQANSDDGVAR